MLALFINGGPRKNWTTVKMLESAMKGARDAGAETELVHLFDYEYSGCRSCFACKLKNSKTNGICAIRDAIRPLLEKCYEADIIVIGSPVYLSNPTGAAKSFMERLIYPLLSYNPKANEAGEIESSIRKKKVPTAMIYSMGDTKEHTDQLQYPLILGEYARFMKMAYGSGEILCTYSGYQFDDYSRYDLLDGVQEYKTKYRDEQLPKDLDAAYELGKRLAASCRFQ
ncbi:flavodoxin family protein [bacterium]|nr:flavodoxin family protein [bacterium]